MANVKSMIGLVVSTKMDKTVVVAVEKQKQHSLYHKTYRIMVKYLAHDEKNECKLDDKVRIVETRPLSKLKRWRVAEVLSRGDVPEVKPEEVI
ncbi:MAG: 30S ribosomal protein S17 [Dehalococcoidia bacterium]|nr:30S ribosomal protein S17 [Dehalococcoidia bacterium]MCL2615386.1 30S ribosomal protein S17 [Dehalococcoidia bacterium]